MKDTVTGVTPKVFVAQEGPFDYTSGNTYGDLVFCSFHEITPTRGGMYNAQIIDGIKKAMEDYVPGQDYILLSGSPIAIAHCLAIAFNKFRKPCEHHMLKWDSQRGQYVPYVVIG